MYNPVNGYQFVHGSYSAGFNNREGVDALIANVKNVSTGESRLHIIQNPQIQFWVTKEALRNHTEKKECCSIHDVDMYVSEYKSMNDAIGRALGYNYSFTNKRKFLESPYVYGVDIDPLVRMKLEYMNNCPDSIDYFKVGALDIETSVLGDNQIILMSYADFHTRKVYCGVLNDWAGVTIEELQEATTKEYNKFREGLNDAARKIWDAQPFEAVYELFEDELDLIIWTFNQIHICKPDFCGIWNISYDIPYILERLAFRGAQAEDVFCHPDVPPVHRYITFKEDVNPKTHIADRWHQVNCPGYTKWYDPMCLYSKLRVVDAKLPFYTLDFVGNKIIGSGKMQFGINATHHAMQTNDKLGYCVYNTMDTIIPVLANAVTNDVVSMTILAGCSLINQFAFQSVKLKAFFYEYCMNNDLVPGSTFGSQVQETDVYIGNVGGAVLNPQLMRAKGAKCIKEVDIHTNIYKLCCDIDFTSQYPSILIASNISKATKLGTFIWLSTSPHTLEEVEETKEVKDAKGKLNPRARANSEHMFNFLCRYTALSSNAVDLGKDFGLPGYMEMLDLWDQQNN